jgi:hypothetical protein
MSEETTENNQAVEKKQSKFSFFRYFIILVIIAIIAGAAGYFFNNKNGAVAIVNGQKIARSLYNERYAQLSAAVASQGRSATTTEMQTLIKTQTLDNLTSEALLLEAAGKENIKADTTAVDTQFAKDKSGFTDATAFEKALTSQGFTDSSYKEALIRNNIIQQYLAKHIDIASVKATPAEVRALYDQSIVGSTNVPPFAEVKAQVENQIIQQKQQQLISTFIQQLKASSTIQTLI